MAEEMRLDADGLSYISYDQNSTSRGEPVQNQTFEFVTVVGKPSDFAREENMKVVRTQAMQSFIRKRDQLSSSRATGNPLPPQAKNEQNEQNELAQWRGRFRVAPSKPTISAKFKFSRQTSRSSARGVRYHIDPSQLPTEEISPTSSSLTMELQPWHSVRQQTSCYMSTVGVSRLDPFNVLPIAIDAHSGLLLDIHNTQAPTNSIAINPANDFLKYAFFDPALFHSMLYLAAMYLDLKQGTEDSRDYLYHGSKVVGIVNNTLNSKTNVLTEHVVAAVAMLALKENISWDYDAATVHMQGLREMVRLRGGIHTMQIKVLQQAVAWTDFSYAICWDCRPFFPRLNIDRSFPYFFQEDHSCWLDPGRVFGARSSIVDTIRDLRLISISLSGSQASPFIRQATSNLIYHIEYDLVELNTKVSLSSQAMHFLIPLLVTTFQLYLALTIRGIPEVAKLILSLIAKLKKRIETRVQDLWSLLPEERIWLLWMFAVGSRASYESEPERLWFVQKVVDMCKLMGIESEASLSGFLKRVIWQNRICVRNCSELWVSVVKLLNVA